MKKLLPLVVVLAIVLGGLLLASCGQQSDPNVAALSGEKTRFQWVVADKATIEQGGLTVTGATTLGGASTLASLTVSGATALDGGLTMDTNKFTVANGTGDTVIAGTLAANGGVTVDTTNFVVNGTTGAVSTASNLTVGGTAKVTGATTITGTLTAVGTVAAADITVSDDMTITDRIAVGTVAAADITASDDVTITDRLFVSGIARMDNNFYVDGNTFLGATHFGSYVYMDDIPIYLDTNQTAYLSGSAGLVAITVPSTGSVSIANGDLIVDTGDLTVSGSTLITGELTINGLATIDAAQGNITTAGTIDVDGYASFSVEPTIVTTDTVLTTAMKTDWQVLQNQGSFSVTLTLPAAVAGLNYCFYNYDGDDVLIDPATGDTIYVLTNAAGDRVSNTTAGNSICLLAIDADTWIVMQSAGTWSDAD